MTREEAIRQLDGADVAVLNRDFFKFNQAIIMAISALRQLETVTNRNGLNEPLTLDELRKMDGEPVWVQFLNHAVGYLDISSCHNSEFFKFCWSGFLLIDEYGKTWLAYRQKPEEGAV